MSTYCNITDIKLRIDDSTYTSLTGDDPIIGDALCLSVIDSIDELARELIIRSYDDTTSLEGSIVLKNICVELAICALINRRANNGVLMGEEQHQKCTNAMETLQAIGNGEITIIVNGEEVAPKTAPVGLGIKTVTIADSENPPYWY